MKKILSSFVRLKFYMSEDPNELSVHISKISNVTNSEYIQEIDDYIKSLDPYKAIELSCNTIMSENDVPISAVRFSFILLGRYKNIILSSWDSIPLENRDFIKETLMSGILSGDIPSRNCAAAAYAFIVDADKPFGILNDILNTISQHIINSQISDQNKVGSVFALKEMLQLNILSTKLDFYLESFQVFSQYLIYILSNPSQFEDDFFAIIDCYNYIIPFYQTPLNSENECKEQIITQIQSILDSEKKGNYYDCLYYFLFIIFRTCYSTITENMKQIFEICIATFSSQEEDLILPSIRFWKEVADYENLLIVGKKKSLDSKDDEIEVKNIILTVSQELIEPIVEFMINFSHEDPPDENDDESIPCIEASDTLLSFSHLTSIVFEFVQGNFEGMSVSPEKKVRYVALILLRCIAGGPNEHDQVTFIESHFNHIISMMEDPALLIKDAVLYIINIIFDLYQPIATNESFFDALGKVLIDSPFEPSPLAIRACDIVNTIGIHFKDIKDKCPIFQKAFPDMINIMKKMLEREDAPLSKLGSHCTVALASIINSTPTCHEDIIVELLNNVNEQIRSEITREDIIPTEYTQTIIQYLCIVIWAIVQRLNINIDPYSEPILDTLLAILTKKSEICHEDGLLALSSLISVLREKIKPFIPRIIEVFNISQESKMEEIVKMSAYLIFCLFKSVGQFLASDQELNQTILNNFFENLSDENIFITAKIEILNAMSEMIKFLNFSILAEYEEQLKQFHDYFNTNQENLDMETTCHLCTAILNGYQTLVQITADTENAQNIIYNFKNIIELFEKMNTFKSSMTEGLMNAIVSFLYEVLKDQNISRRVNTKLHRNCIASILNYISNNEDMVLGFRAAQVHDKIKTC